MTNKENTKLAHNSIAKKYYEAYKDDENSLCPTTLVLYAKKC